METSQRYTLLKNRYVFYNLAVVNFAVWKDGPGSPSSLQAGMGQQLGQPGHCVTL